METYCKDYNEFNAGLFCYIFYFELNVQRLLRDMLC